MIKKDCFDSDLKKAHNYLLEEKFTQAIDLFYKLEIEKPQDAQIKLYLGTALIKNERYSEAVKALQNGIKVSNTLMNLHYALGVSYFELQDYPKALREFANEIKLNPTNPIPFCESGYALYELKEYEKAIIFIDKAIQLDQGYGDAYHCMGATLNNLERYKDALRYALKAIDIDHSKAEFYFSVGNIYFSLRKKNEAIKYFEKAIQINPSYYEALHNKGLVHLTFMEFQLGWPLYEYRPSLDQLRKKNQLSKYTAEIKKDLANILVLKEQGIGDQILYSSFLSELNLDKNIHIEIDERLIPVLKRSFSKINFEEKANKVDLKNYNFILAMGSLGLFFQKKYQDSSKRHNSFLISDEHKTQNIRKKIINNQGASRVYGLSWKSNNEEIGKNKSIHLESFIDLLNIPNTIFVSLQYDSDEREMVDFFQKHNVKLFLFNDIDLYNDIDSLFSVIDACDAIVTVSNINAHVSGSLGKKTYLLAPLSKGRHWYWHDGLKTSLWYPSIQIFSQTETGDWSAPINEIREKIVEEILHE